MSSEKSEARKFAASVDEARDAASDALASLGATVEVSADGKSVSGTTGWSLMSFGEHVEIDLRSEGDGVEVSVKSMQRRGQFRDLSRRNDKPVGKILNAMETRLRS